MKKIGKSARLPVNLIPKDGRYEISQKNDLQNTPSLRRGWLGSLFG